MPKSKLTVEQQTYVVQALACFDTPSVVAAAIKRDLGITLTPQSIEAYDPNKRAGRNLAVRWKSLFEETRKTFLEDTSKIAISHRAVRLRALQRMADKAEDRGNLVLASSLLKQAAEESGGVYTNRRELAGKLEHGVTGEVSQLLEAINGKTRGLPNGG
ncbi:hypothetical protein FHX10_004545 [Rhizobium sp. BK591]|uniref:DUF2280 domain-containing protein n=1 Tax=Rhizobium sp. BK591 TaxID=2586985 RepID=UPI00161229D6|nr:DUF2280 domain-containing protein [Rhizobium sp. BK591]MBB3745008.1 hypothetical protein [Rhizobium sp. BK591]